MTDMRRDTSDGNVKPNANRSSSADREQDERDDITRRRELAREAQLTHREREERWPIG